MSPLSYGAFIEQPTLCLSHPVLHDASVDYNLQCLQALYQMQQRMAANAYL